MNDEEREAVEYWKTHMKILHLNTQLASEHYIKVLLDLVEKQSKEIEEIEELKEENEKYKNPPFFDEENYTENDKIKAKIQELNEDFKEYENGQEWEIQDEIRGQIEVLQSFLADKE